MKKFFTLFALALVAMAVNAQKTWNFSTWEDGSYANQTVDGLTLVGDDGKWIVDGNNYSDYTKRLKSGGSYKASFAVDGNSKITLVCTTSSSSAERTVTLAAGEADPFATLKVQAKGSYEAEYTGAAATITIGMDGGVNFYAIIVEPASAPTPDPTPGGETEKYVAVTNVDGVWTAADVFANATVDGGESVVKFGTANMDVVAIGSTTPKDVESDPGVFPGWKEWNEVKWDVKNQGDINFGYVVGTGNPAISYCEEEIVTDGVATGKFRPAYEFYEADGSKGLPHMGLYYMFSPKASGQLKAMIWVNKGNRYTYLVDEATKKPIAYTAEGYINGQNNEEGQKRWLTSDDIQALSNPEKPYVIGAGNQPFWGNVTADVEAGKTYWLFVHNAQIGFQGYEFTVTSGIQDIIAAPASKIMKTIKNGKIVIINGNNTYNVAGQLVK